jgi:hypothetical protein
MDLQLLPDVFGTEKDKIRFVSQTITQMANDIAQQVWAIGTEDGFLEEEQKSILAAFDAGQLVAEGS